ncbi:Rrf2 family protein [Puniceicoccus vermicola]
MSHLAEVYPVEGRLSSQDIALKRNLPKQLVAKILVVLSQANLVSSVPGPGGGYWLRKPPSEISLLAIVSLFEKGGDMLMCPFGPDWCGNGDPCPLHDQLVQLNEQMNRFLSETTLDVFARGEVSLPSGG